MLDQWKVWFCERHLWDCNNVHLGFKDIKGILGLPPRAHVLFQLCQSQNSNSWRPQYYLKFDIMAIVVVMINVYLWGCVKLPEMLNKFTLFLFVWHETVSQSCFMAWYMPPQWHSYVPFGFYLTPLYVFYGLILIFLTFFIIRIWAGKIKSGCPPSDIWQNLGASTT